MIRLQYKILLSLYFLAIYFAQTRVDTVKIVFKDKINSETEFTLNYKNRINNFYLADSIRFNILESLFERGNILAEIKEYNEYPLPINNNQEPRINIIVKVEKGNIALVRKIVLQNTDLDDDENEKLLYYFNDIINEKYSPRLFEEKLNWILQEYKNQGYAFAEININSFLPQIISDSLVVVDINLEFKKNNRYRINDIVIPDSVMSKETFIKKIIKLDKKFYLNKENLELVQTRLQRQRYYENIKEPIVKLVDSSNAIMNLFFTERKMNNFDGLVGYVPQTKNSIGYFTGFIKLKLQNLFGTGRDFAFDWSKQSSLSQEFVINYMEMFLLNTDFSFNLNYNYRKQDSLFSANNLSIDLSLPFYDNFVAGLSIGYENSTPGSFYTKLINSSNAITTGVFVNYDSRDKLFNSRKGMFLENIYKYSSTKTNLNGNYNLQRYEVNFQNFIPISNKNIIAIKASVRYLITPKPAINDYYYLGGNNTLRGYIEKQFMADKVFWSNLEYRFFFEEESYLFSFFDTGYYDRSEIQSLNIPKQNELLYGFGLGIGFSTNFGVFNVSYAVGKNESFSDGKIHIGVNTNF